MTKVTIQPRRARPFFARHPWVFAGSIARVDGPAAAGEEVTVVSHENQFIARGLFNPQSAIRVRLYRWDDAPLDEAFWRSRIDAAVALRSETLHLDGPQSACRIISSEADGISGLTIDRYDRWLVAQITSLALYERRELLIRLLVERTAALGVILRVDRAIAEQEGLPSAEGLAWGTEPDGPIPILEHGLTYEGRPAIRPEDRLLPRPARQSPGGLEIRPQPAGSRPVLLHRRLRAERLEARRSIPRDRVRFFNQCHRDRSQERRGQRFRNGPVRSRRRFRSPGEDARTGRKIRPRRLRPPQIRPHAPAPGRGDEGVSPPQPDGRGRSLTRRNPGHLFVFRARRSTHVRQPARPGGRAFRKAHSDFGAARPGRRSSRLQRVSGDGLSEMLRLPRLVGRVQHAFSL